MVVKLCRMNSFARCCPVHESDILGTYATGSSISRMLAHDTKDTSAGQRKCKLLCPFLEMREEKRT